MRITCPSCHAVASLDVLVGREVETRAVAELLSNHLPLGHAVTRYVALFRPPLRKLGLARMAVLMDEVMVDINRQAITRKGRDWPAPHEVWVEAINQVIAARDKGSLTLPLTSHGYLHEIIVGLADKAEALQERAREKEARSRTHTAGPTAMQTVIDGPLTVVAPVTPPASYTAGPSRAAREIRAKNEAIRQAREDAAKAAAGAAADQPPGAPQP